MPQTKYCSIDQLCESENITGYLPKVTNTKERARGEEVIERISAMIDDYVSNNRQKNVFAPSPDLPSVKRVRGQGYSFLKLPDFVEGSLSKIALNENELDSTFWETEGNKLILIDEYGTKQRDWVWSVGKPYSITARWGFEEIPKPIITACINWSVDEIRFSDGNFQGIVGGVKSTAQPTPSFVGAGYKKIRPPAVTAILDGYKSNFNRQFGLFA